MFWPTVYKSQERYAGIKGTVAQGRNPPLFLVFIVCQDSLSFLRYKEVNSRNCQKKPLADLNNFPSKRAPVSPLSIGLHLLTLRQKQKVAVLFTKVSTLTPKNVQPPAAGTPLDRAIPKAANTSGSTGCIYPANLVSIAPHVSEIWLTRNFPPLNSM